MGKSSTTSPTRGVYNVGGLRGGKGVAEGELWEGRVVWGNGGEELLRALWPTSSPHPRPAEKEQRTQKGVESVRTDDDLRVEPEVRIAARKEQKQVRVQPNRCLPNRHAVSGAT